ncbi:MAG TPA: hypothetical protein VJ841_04955 [Candidatus Saccharimonadales bacterium]|nr:hypothetical protein [Candidatus Saccharimonadales bacterium]
MSSPNPSPYAKRSSGELFGWATRNKNEVVKTGIITDKAIAEIQQKILTEKDLDVADDITKLRTTIMGTLRESGFNGEIYWNDYYRLLAHHEFLEQLILTPIIFDRYGKNGNALERQALTDTTYETSMRLLNSALDEHDNPDASEVEREGLRGVIHEFALAGVLNHDRSTEHLTLTAPTVSDRVHKTDLIHHTVATGEYEQVNIQVKSDFERNGDADLPDYGGIIITPNEMGNSRRGGLYTARTLIRHQNGTASFDDYAYLGGLQTRLLEKIDHHVRHRNDFGQNAAA